MSKYRAAARADANQPSIVKDLRKLGYSVETGHDDILVGRNGRTYWVEIKDPEKVLNKNGSLKKDALKPSQKRLLKEWKGHYFIACTTEQIIRNIQAIENQQRFENWYKDFL